MTHFLLRAFLWGLVAIPLMGCDLGLGTDDESQKEEARKRDKLFSLYAKVEGTYGGRLERPDGVSYPIEIRLFTMSKNGPKNAD